MADSILVGSAGRFVGASGTVAGDPSDCSCCSCNCPSFCDSCESEYTLTISGLTSGPCCPDVNGSYSLTQDPPGDFGTPCEWTYTGVNPCDSEGLVTVDFVCSNGTLCNGVSTPSWTISINVFFAGGAGNFLIQAALPTGTYCTCPPTGTYTICLTESGACAATVTVTIS